MPIRKAISWCFIPLGSLLLGACGEQPFAAPAHPEVRPRIAAGVPLLSGPVGPTVPTLPAAWSRDGAIACEWAAEKIPEQSVALRTTMEVPPFATLKELKDVRVRLPVGEASQGIEIRATSRGINLNGLAEAKELPLYAAKPIPLQSKDVIVPSGRTPLYWTQAIAGQVDLKVELPSGIYVGPAQQRIHRSCGELSLEKRNFDPCPARGALYSSREGSWVLSWGPGGKTSAVIEHRSNSETDFEVSVLAHNGKFRKVAVMIDEVYVVGWVHRGRFGKEEAYEGLLGLLNTGGGEEAMTEEGTVHAVDHPNGTICAWNAPLIIEQSGVRLVQGTALANHPVELVSQEGGWARIRPPEEFNSPPDVQWLVPAAYLYDCGLEH